MGGQGKPTASGRFGPHEGRLWRHEFAQHDYNESMNCQDILWEQLVILAMRSTSPPFIAYTSRQSIELTDPPCGRLVFDFILRCLDYVDSIPAASYLSVYPRSSRYQRHLSQPNQPLSATSSKIYKLGYATGKSSGKPYTPNSKLYNTVSSSRCSSRSVPNLLLELRQVERFDARNGRREYGDVVEVASRPESVSSSPLSYHRC